MRLKKEYNSVEVLKNGSDVFLLLEEDDSSPKDYFDTAHSTIALNESSINSGRTDFQLSSEKRYYFSN